MTSFRRGDVVLVSFGFTDQTGTKWRPAIVISTDAYNQQTPDMLIVSITGNLQAVPHPGDVPIRDWHAAGLARPSLAQMKIATVEASIIGRKLGALTPADMAAVERGLRLAMGL